MNLTSYFPRVIREWQEDDPNSLSRVVQGSLVFIDISGFTAMSERLAKYGRIGAEEVTEVLDSSFTSLLEAAYEEGGSLLKFGGDAMLLLFTDDQHAIRACRAAARMRARLRDEGEFSTSAGSVRLRMSVGVHSGDVDMFLVGESHRELIVTGPAVTRVVELESAAHAGQIQISEVTSASIPKSWWKGTAEGYLLRTTPVRSKATTQVAPMFSEMENAERFVPTAIRNHLQTAGANESQHRHAIVGFIHFKGIDQMLAQGDRDAVARALSNLVQGTQHAVEELGICFLATDVDRDGGKIILTAGVPTSSGNDEEGMLRAMSRIIALPQPLTLRVGINAGHVFAGDVGPPYRRTYTIMGDAVNLAARLMAKAGDGHVLTVRSVIERSRATFELTEMEPFFVKGKQRPVEALAVGRPIGQRMSRDQVSVPFVGRSAEMELLREKLRATESGSLGIADITGEGGIGKSRLVEELVTQTTIASHTTVCEQYESSTAYFPLRKLLHSIMAIDAGSDPATVAARLTEWVKSSAPKLQEWLPLLAIPLDLSVPSTPSVDRLAPRFRRNQLHRVMHDFLRLAAPQPTIFVFEDSHWMDEATRDLLGDVLSTARGLPWLILATRRSDTSSPFADFEDVTVKIDLPPLSELESVELAMAAFGERPVAKQDMVALTERAGGNPFFLMEMADVMSASGGGEAIPDSVEALLNIQIDRLSARLRRVLRFASVVGPTFNTRLLEESLGDLLTESASDACRDLTDFVTPAGKDSFRFRHELARETAYAGLPFRLRRQLHERLGLSIERRHQRRVEARAELLSLHFHRAHRFDKAFRYSRIAGDRAKAKSANAEAATLYRRALDAARRTDGVTDEEKGEIFTSLGDVCELAAKYDEAAHALREARRLVQGNAEQCRLLRKEGIVRERLGKYGEALRWYSRGLRLGEDTDVHDINQLQLAYAGVRFRQGDYAECARRCQMVIPSAEAAGDRTSLAHAYYLLDHAHTMLGNSEAGAFRALALPIYEELGDTIGQANVLNNLGVAASIDGDWNEAVGLFERSKVARERGGDVVGAATAINNIGEVLLDRGQLEEAEAMFREALSTWRAANYAVGIAVATSALGLAATRGGKFEEARRLLTDALEDFRAIGAESFVDETEVRLVELYLALGDDERARQSVEALLAARKAADGGPLGAAIYRFQAAVLMRANLIEEATAAINESIELARSISARYELALSLRVLATLLETSGEASEQPREESRRIFAQLGVNEAALT